jgi:hypothetical protein
MGWTSGSSVRDATKRGCLDSIGRSAYLSLGQEGAVFGEPCGTVHTGAGCGCSAPQACKTVDCRENAPVIVMTYAQESGCSRSLQPGCHDAAKPAHTRHCLLAASIAGLHTTQAEERRSRKGVDNLLGSACAVASLRAEVLRPQLVIWHEHRSEFHGLPIYLDVGHDEFTWLSVGIGGLGWVLRHCLRTTCVRRAVACRRAQIG